MHVIARSCVLHVEEPSWCAMGKQAAETIQRNDDMELTRSHPSSGRRIENDSQPLTE